MTSSEQDHEDLIEILSQVLQSKLDQRSPSPTSKMVCCNYKVANSICESRVNKEVTLDSEVCGILHFKFGHEINKFDVKSRQNMLLK